MTLDTTALERRPLGLLVWVQAGLVAALLVAVYHRTAATLWMTWTTNDNYSHGPLVPLVSAWLAWMDRERLRRLPVAADNRGLVLVALACGLQVFGMRGDVFALEGYSWLAMAYGLSWAFLGAAWTRALAFPIGFMAFMLTFPPFVMNQLSFALKEITVRISAWLAEGLGVTLQRSGMIIYLLTGELRIENPCSGLRSLLTLLATGAVFAYLQPGGVVPRVALLLGAVPVAMIANALRIAGLMVVGHFHSVEKATRFHDLSGYAVYAIALCGLFGLRAVLLPRAREPQS
ncbi:MAG TPA: exosortase/archaeosortase family protein [Candidatus Limnocylindria bacterium]|nr:exosortase/archaeosortase family protein [Candidatus Limnocylindria bacterium]